ncbi:hypothetical protein [Allokutzneria albata]|uniref:hypothetical protein n=1 Tax=Allokutzneria albata TaxID=211114 RepID=UPI0004C34954|nr:hypothetical protein [Allokutzneria albata]
MLRGLRSHIRSRDLPRPDHLTISTRSRSLSLTFVDGASPDRLAALLLWAATLEGLSLTWSCQRDVLHIVGTGRTHAGIRVNLAACGQLPELAGRIRAGIVVVAGTYRFPVSEPESVQYHELMHVARAARAVVKAAAA